MTKETDPSDDLRKVVRLLDQQRRMLEEAGSEPGVVELFSAVVRRVGRMSDAELRKTSKSASHKIHDPRYDIDVNALSLTQIEELVRADDTPRKILEAVAIKRFQVPSGSMRSFSNIGALREKISTRVENERTHRAIDSLARRTKG